MQEQTQNSTSWIQNGRVKVVRCNRAKVAKVIDDSEPTPMMEDVKIKPIDGKDKPSIMEVFPDTGCQQSIISQDSIKASGLKLDRSRRKRILAVDGTRVPCIGSTTFQVTYGKYTTNILTLITPALNREIILSWRALQRLGVIPKDFPKPRLSQQ